MVSRRLTTLCLGSCLAFCGAGSVLAETPLPRQIPLFEAGKEGSRIFRIPSLLVSAKGTLLAFAELRRTQRRFWGDVDVVLKRSFDNGDTWQPTQILADLGADTCGNPCSVADPATGILWLLLTRSRGQDREEDIVAGKAAPTTVWVAHSRDDGATWTAPVDISSSARRPEWGWYGTGPGCGLALKGGRLFIPAYHSEAGTYKSHGLFSDDHGRTWRLGATVGDNTSECQAVERKDGSLLINCRTTKGDRRTIAASADGGSTWSKAVPAGNLVENDCYGCLYRVAGAGRGGADVWLFANTGNRSRANVGVRMSEDEGASWPYARVLTPGPSAYCVLARLPDGRIGYLVERGEKDLYEQIAFGRMTLDWIR